MLHPRGRGNGLEAVSFSPLADLAPQVADAVLELLALEGIAALASPASERAPGDILITPVGEVLDRVFVDTAARIRARELLDQYLPTLEATEEPPERETEPASDGRASSADDDVWAALVASFHAVPEPGVVPSWPSAEDLPDQRPPEADRHGGRTLRRAREAPDDGWAAWADPGPAPRRRAGDVPELAASDDDHYVPPPPPPVPRGDAISRWAWLGTLGSPLLLLFVAVTGETFGGWFLLIGALGFMAGFITLVARMDDRDPPGSGPDDDGAVV